MEGMRRASVAESRREERMYGSVGASGGGGPPLDVGCVRK